MENRYIAAIDLGTSKMVGVIGSKNEDGHLVVLAVEKEESGGSVKRGVIQNVEEAASRIKKIVAKLENRIPDRIGKIYVGVGGQSLHAVDHTVRRQLNEDTQVTEELIGSMLSEGRNLPLFNAEIVEVVPAGYRVDNRPEIQPRGVYCSEIEADLKVVVGRPTLKKNSYRTLTERLRIPVARYIAAPLATAAATLSEDEKKLGCALIDFGAGTTTLSVYKEGFLRYLVTVPFGGGNITRDICSLNVLEPDAEALKIAYGRALPAEGEDEKNNQPLKIEGMDASRIKYQTLCNVVEARIEEIVENLIAQIDRSGYDGQLSAGLVITGGASQLKELPRLLKQKTGLPVRKAAIQKEVSFVNKGEALFNPAHVQAIGLLLLGDENCMKEREQPAVSAPQPVRPPKPKPEKSHPASNLWGGLKRKMGEMFEEDDTELR